MGCCRAKRTLIGAETKQTQPLAADPQTIRTLESRVRESDGGDRIDREIGRIFGVGRKSSQENFSCGCGGGRRMPDIFGREKHALTEYEKSIGEHYSMLRSYGKAILDSNPRSTVKLRVTVNPDGKTYFDSPNQGEILIAIGRDGNNHIYPVAWVVVNIENKDNRTWFLELMEEDLGCSRGNGLTLMSDQHKGLIEAVKDIMEKIKSVNPNAHKYLMDKNPKPWSRAFFEVDRGCEAIENGFSECFNSVIVNVRHKPLLTMLESIRVIVLERMNKIREISRKLNPRFGHVIPAGENLFEVRSESEGFTIDEDMYFMAYHNYVKPVPGMNFWPDQSMYSTVLPPKPRKMPGRPRKKRIKTIGSKGKGGAAGSRGGASGSIGRGAGGSGGSGGANGLRSRGTARSRSGVSWLIGRGNGGSNRRHVSTAGTQKRQGKKKVGASGFVKWFGLQDEPDQTQAEPQQTQHEPEQTQVENQVEQTKDQAEIDLTKLEQTQEPTQDQVHPQEQPQQAALRMPSARILQRKLGKQGSSQNTALNLD
ncbi:multidrug resistance-associated protein 5 [Tanacetum coccineum]|uniref:Multidrug resistance-associated protein 5 n=1 Tax=Tanacetum coccineum TaxID=301880 RepID=A0ABQ5AZE2_9ASTR